VFSETHADLPYITFLEEQYHDLDSISSRSGVSAGICGRRPIDELVVQRHQAQQKRYHPITRQEVARFCYLKADDQTIKLVCMGMPLDAWHGGIMVIIGTNTIIGEFEGNRDLVGLTGTQLKMQPLAWLREPEDQRFPTASALLAQISEQVRNQGRIERVQRDITKKYHW
jgi:hypothetical protein